MILKNIHLYLLKSILNKLNNQRISAISLDTFAIENSLTNK